MTFKELLDVMGSKSNTLVEGNLLMTRQTETNGIITGERRIATMYPVTWLHDTDYELYRGMTVQEIAVVPRTDIGILEVYLVG